MSMPHVVATGCLIAIMTEIWQVLKEERWAERRVISLTGCHRTKMIQDFFKLKNNGIMKKGLLIIEV